MTVKDLRTIRNAFGESAEKHKQAFVAKQLKTPPRLARDLIRAHDDLLFLKAFPGEAQTARSSEAALRQFDKWVARLPKSAAKLLNDTGVAGSVTNHIFGFPVADWLARHSRGDAEIDWRGCSDPSMIDPLLRIIMRKSEQDAFDSGDYSTRDWVGLARSAGSPSDLYWMMKAARDAKTKRAIIDEAWSAAEAPITWRLGRSRWATTRNFLAGSSTVARKGFRRPPEDIERRISKPLKAICLLPRARARQVVDTARAALAARCREVVAITYPNVDEVYWCDLGEGVALAVMVVAPTHRLTLETNTGYLLLSNGVPIGYGGVTPLFRQANTGINIFDAFRGGETAFLWVEMLRAFRSLFGSRRFIVNGYQFGEGNTEAINSGAYWFYYRLGFRPLDTDRRLLAAKEFDRLRRPGAARSSKATLKALAKGDLVLDLPDYDASDSFDEKQLVKVSALASRQIAAIPLENRAEAERRLAEDIAKALGACEMQAWSIAERDAFNAMAPIVAIAPDVADWSALEKKSTVKFMRAKGGLFERDFARAAADCPRLFRFLATA